MEKSSMRKGRATLAMLATLAAMMGAQALSPGSAAAMPSKCAYALGQWSYYEYLGDIDLTNIWRDVAVKVCSEP
jgi:peptidoglycan/LPS O-acetylase OafA/YrhL